MTYTTPVIHAEGFEANNSAYFLATNHSLSECSTILMLSGNSFGNMWMKGMLKSPKVAQKDNEQTISQKVWYLKSLQIIEK